MATDLRENILQIVGGVVVWMKYERVFQGRKGGRRGRVDAGRGKEWNEGMGRRREGR
jgi:hypothetical protein